MESLKTATKDRRRLEDELGVLQGRELYDATLQMNADCVAPSSGSPQARSIRCGRWRKVSAHSRERCFIGVVEDPPALLLAASEDSGVDAGKLIKAALSQAGGRGGGAADLAQGSVPTREALESALVKANKAPASLD